MLKSWIGYVLCVAAIVSSGCRQPDGPVPQPTREEQNEIGDVSRDLLSVAGGDKQAQQDLSDDLANFSPYDAATRFAPQMAARLSRALTGRKVTDEQARAISQQMFVAFSANKLAARQITGIQEEIRKHLAQIGTPEPDIVAVVNQIASVQAAINEAPKRWYQVR